MPYRRFRNRNLFKIGFGFANLLKIYETTKLSSINFKKYRQIRSRRATLHKIRMGKWKMHKYKMLLRGMVIQKNRRTESCVEGDDETEEQKDRKLGSVNGGDRDVRTKG